MITKFQILKIKMKRDKFEVLVWEHWKLCLCQVRNIIDAKVEK